MRNLILTYLYIQTNIYEAKTSDNLFLLTLPIIIETHKSVKQQKTLLSKYIHKIKMRTF